MNSQPTCCRELIDWLCVNDNVESCQCDELSLAQQSQQNALQLFHDSAKRVPAYRSFLEAHSVRPASIQSYSDFSTVPPTTKDNYVYRYPFVERCWDGNSDGLSTISSSSGTTGTPAYWPQTLVQFLEGARAHEHAFSPFNTRKVPTLLINGFAMGNWIAGTFTHTCVQLLSWKGHRITLMSPGYDKEAVISTLLAMKYEYAQIILTGHTPFIKEVVDTLQSQGVDLKKLNIKLIGTGQAITENWRHYIATQIGQDVKDDTSVLNLYGSADAALMGFETHQSVQIRRILSNNSMLSRQIFSDDRLPSLYQYDPLLTFFESVNNELHITKNAGAPLVRYNIQDRGGVFRAEELKAQLRGLDIGYKSRNEGESTTLHFPFVYLFGREQYMVKIYGANVYAEHVQTALTHEQLLPYLAGRYNLEASYDDVNELAFYIHAELVANVQATPDIEKLVQQIFIQEVCRMNKEYEFVVKTIGSKAYPIIRLHAAGESNLFPKGKMKKNA